MANPREEAVREWIESHKARSMAPLREAIIAEWNAQGRGPFPYESNSFRVMLSNWKGGKNDLKGHEALQAIVAKVLDRDRAELFPERVRSAWRHPMRGFELLGALDVAAESSAPAACFVQVGAPNSPRELYERRIRNTPTWLVAPPGAGRTLAALRYELDAVPPPKSERDDMFAAVTERITGLDRRRPRVLKLRSLDELERVDLPGEDTPLVVKVDVPGDADARWAAALGTRQYVRVLAGFDLTDAQRALNAESHPHESPWERWRWSPTPSWRRVFVAWVEDRLRERIRDGMTAEGLLSAEAVCAWLDRVDPELTQYGTPGDLLPLLALAHEHGEKQLPRKLDGEFVLGVLKAQAMRVEDIEHRAWLRDEGATTLRKLLLSAWADPGVRWPANLSVAGWSERVPRNDSLPQGDRDRRAEALVREMAASRSPKRRAMLLKEHTALHQSVDRPRDAVRALVSAGLLQPAGGRDYTPGPRWAQEILVRDALVDEFRRAPPSRWGRLAADAARQASVDRALVSLSDKEFFGLVDRAVGDATADDLGSIAAFETLFLAAGERLYDRQATAVWGTGLHALWTLQRRLLLRSQGGTFVTPRTRSGPGEPHRGGARWWAACWSWSFAVARPDGPLPAVLGWLLPGWFERLDAPPEELRSHRVPANAGDHTAEAVGVARLLAMSQRVAARWSGPVRRAGAGPAEGTESDGAARGPFDWDRLLDVGANDWPDYPDVLVAGAVPIAPRTGWPMPSLAKQLLRRQDALTDFVAAQIEELPAQEREAVLAALWGTTLGGSVAPVSERLWPATGQQRSSRKVSRLGELLRRSFPVDAVVHQIRRGFWLGADSCRGLLREAPEAHRRALTQALLKDDQRKGELIDVLLETPAPFLDLLADVAPNIDRGRSHRIARRLWEMAPDQAEALGEADWRDRAASHPWLEAVPAEHALRVVSVFLRHPERAVPEAFLHWFARTLPEFGPQADAVFGLLQRHGWRHLALE